MNVLSSERTRPPKIKRCTAWPACRRPRSSQPRPFRTRCVSLDRPTPQQLGWDTHTHTRIQLSPSLVLLQNKP